VTSKRFKVIGALGLAGLWGLGCMGGGGDDGAEPTTDDVPEGEAPVEPEPEPEPEPEVPEVQLQAYVVTSGARSGRRALDGDRGTGWQPLDDARGEGMLLRFDEPMAVASLELTACATSEPFDVELYANGRRLRQETIDGATTLKLPGRGVRSVFAKILDRSACVSEVSAVVDGGPVRLVPPRQVEARIDVSSTLQPAPAYHWTYLFDGRTHFAWVEGAEGIGDGESIDFTFPEAQHISGLQIWNGYQRSRDHFEKNGRIRKMEIEAGGRRTMFDLDDGEMGPQSVRFDPPLNTRYLTLTLAAVTKGSAYEDTVISELRFRDRKGWFTIVPSTPPELDRRLRARLEGMALGEIIDKLYTQACGPRRELKLRADHSFVRYETSEDDESTRTEVFDGAWVPRRGSKVKLYGRRHVATKEWQPYGGPSEEEETGVSGGTITVRPLSEVTDDEVKSLVSELSRAGAEERVECLQTDGRFDPEKVEALVAKGAILVEGAAITDLMIP